MSNILVYYAFFIALIVSKPANALSKNVSSNDERELKSIPQKSDSDKGEHDIVKFA